MGFNSAFKGLRCLLQSPAMRSNAGMANRQGDVELRFAQVSVPS